MPKHSFLTRSFFLLIITAISISCLSPVSAAEHPNIVLIITDDQGYGPLAGTGTNGSRRPILMHCTTRARAFTRFLVSPTCSPAVGTHDWPSFHEEWHHAYDPGT